MTTSFAQLMTDCLVALGDPTRVTWSRADTIWPWCIEAMKTFPIARPMLDDHTNGASVVYSLAMPTDFRDVISVEYPISQQPPVYLVMKNRLDPEFYHQAGFYDIDHDYSTGSGWLMYVSGGLAGLAPIKTQLLGQQDHDMDDDELHLITVPDEFEHILIAQVMCYAYRERLSNYMQDPTAQTSIITDLSEMTHHMEEYYNSLVVAAQAKLAESKISPRLHVDKYDKVY